MSSLLSFLVLALIATGLASAKIQLLDERKAGYDANVNFFRQAGASDRHFIREEVLDFLAKQVYMKIVDCRA